MKTVLHPSYFPSIQSFAAVVRYDICWEMEDNYQKQTYRNRCYICTDQGKHMLTIPIQHVGGNHGRQKFKHVKIDNTYSWQRQHWRTLETAYRTSPFFEFYEDEFLELFQNQYDYLLDFNLKTIQTLCAVLQLPIPKTHTNTYQTELPKDTYIDARFLINAKKEKIEIQEPYNQVFAQKHGFIPNTSVLDLLFNEGPNTLHYLNTYTIDFLDASV